MKKGNLLYFIFIFLVISIYIYPFTVFSIEEEKLEEIEEQVEISDKENQEVTINDDNEGKIDIDTKTENIIEPEIEYSTHIQNIGWQKYMKDGEMSGTSGKSLRLEGIKIRFTEQSLNQYIEYSTHIQNIGWEKDYKKGDNISGTVGKSLRLEAIQIRLTGELAEKYDIYYRTHVQNEGWLDWAKNGEKAGTEGYAYRLEGIEIKLVKKDEAAPGETKKAFIEPLVSYTTHIQSIGWQDSVKDGATSGTIGKSLRLEGIKIALKSAKYKGNIVYQTHIQNIGWQNPVRNGELSGTIGKSLRLEAIKISLEGEISNYYDIYYRVHAENFGWLDWTKNGEKAGTLGYGYRLEAIEIKLIEKGEKTPENTENHFIKRMIKYSIYQNSKWQNGYDGQEIGAKGKKLESIGISLFKDDYAGNILYSTYITGDGWQNYVSNSTTSNKTGNKIEALKIKLDGDITNYYDIYYGAYISNKGWTGWAKNDEPCGNVGYGNNIEKIRVKLIEKGKRQSIDTNEVYIEDELRVKYTTYVDGKWQNYVQNGEVGGTTGKTKHIKALKVYLNKKTIKGTIAYSAHVSNVGWVNWTSDNNQSGIINQNIEAIRIKLTGALESHYDIYYRAHVSDVGWMGWTSNGKEAGTQTAGLGIEAIQVVLVEKGQPAPENTDNLKTTEPFLSARWVTESDGHKYFYDIYGNKIMGCGYKIGNTIHYFGPTGIYLGMNNLEVLDISAHNGRVDWQSVASSGVYGVILRIAASAEYRDSRIKENVAECKKYGIPYGIYIYSYAENYSEGQAYGRFTRALMEEFDMHPTLGIFLDLESNNITQFMGPDHYTAVVKGYYSIVPEAEVYTYTYYANTALNTKYIRDKITWMADYRGKCYYEGSYRMWQYTSSGRNAGVNGDVDRSKLYSFR